jgi:hypothetical protein
MIPQELSNLRYVMVICSFGRTKKSVVSLLISQNYLKCMYIERCPNINFSKIISDMKWIYAAYRIFKFGVKP